MIRLLTLIACLGLCACGGSRYGSGIPETYDPLLDAALAECPRADSLRHLLRETPREEREAMAWLVAWMPQGDRDTMRLDLLRENVAYACKAREVFPWTKTLPDSLFLNEVLPYAVVDEVRDAWRGDFFDRFTPCVAGCRTLREAAEAVNRAIVERVGVEYNTRREKTNQSPSESMRQHMASCTGLSVLLVDALRAVGIPARFVGTAAWHDNRGNHSWTEVWFDDAWLYGVLLSGVRPGVVSGRCRTGYGGRPSACRLCRVVPPDGRLVPDGVERVVARRARRGGDLALSGRLPGGERIAPGPADARRGALHDVPQPGS